MSETAHHGDDLTDDQWARLAPLMPGGCKGKRGPRTDNRRFLNAVLWMARSGAKWSYLPQRFGRYGTVKQRYYDWVARGVFADLFKALNEDADLEWLCIDATIIRAHQHAAGAPLKKGGSEAQAIGRSKGGLTTKLHGACDALGLPLRFVASPGHRGEVLYGAQLIEGFAPTSVIADRAYDAEHFHDAILDQGATPVIPPRANRRRPHACDWVLYKERNAIERLFNKLKHFRRVATRYDKLVDNFIGFVTIAAIHILLR